MITPAGAEPATFELVILAMREPQGREADVQLLHVPREREMPRTDAAFRPPA